MKIVSCVGSHRKKGNTAHIVDAIEAQLRAEAAGNGEPLEIETVYLGHHDIGLCRGCRVCFDRGEERCPLKDDLLAIKAKIQAADGLIVASPIYVDDVSGTLKNWIDRLAHVCHRPEFAGKCVYLVATTGGSPTGHAMRTMRTAMMSWGCHVVGQAGFNTGALMARDELEARYAPETARIARELFQAIHERQFTRPSFLSLMTFKIQQQAWQGVDGDSLDARYWRQSGWTEPGREFFIDHKANHLKVYSARLAGAVLSKFMT
jgi:multimeric flavodoxin WrbA